MFLGKLSPYFSKIVHCDARCSCQTKSKYHHTSILLSVGLVRVVFKVKRTIQTDGLIFRTPKCSAVAFFAQFALLCYNWKFLTAFGDFWTSGYSNKNFELHISYNLNMEIATDS